MHRTTLFALLAIAAMLACVQLGTSAAVARVHSYRAVEDHGLLKFNIRGLDAQRVRSAAPAPVHRTLW